MCVRPIFSSFDRTAKYPSENTRTTAMPIGHIPPVEPMCQAFMFARQ
jgi:hypothetical protein